MGDGEWVLVKIRQGRKAQDIQLNYPVLERDGKVQLKFLSQAWVNRSVVIREDPDKLESDSNS